MEELTLPAQLLKFQLDAALKKYQQGSGNIPIVLTGTPFAEKRLMANVSIMKKRLNNPILLNYCLIGKHITDNNERFSRHKPIHRTAKFLYDYFLDDYPAILYLENVSHTNIIELSAKERISIIEAKSNEDLQGLQVNGTDDNLWHVDGNTWDFAEEVFPEPIEDLLPRPLKRRRVVGQDNDLTVTTSFNYRSILPVSLTPLTDRILGITSPDCDGHLSEPESPVTNSPVFSP
jgi:hypothetical protein